MRRDDVTTVENNGNYSGWTPRSREGRSVSKNTRELQQKTRKIILRYVSALSPSLSLSVSLSPSLPLPLSLYFNDGFISLFLA